MHNYNITVKYKQSRMAMHKVEMKLRREKKTVKDINILIKYSRTMYTIKTSLIWTSNTYSDLCIVLHTICREIKLFAFYTFSYVSAYVCVCVH